MLMSSLSSGLTKALNIFATQWNFIQADSVVWFVSENSLIYWFLWLRIPQVFFVSPLRSVFIPLRQLFHGSVVISQMILVTLFLLLYNDCFFLSDLFIRVFGVLSICIKSSLYQSFLRSNFYNIMLKWCHRELSNSFYCKLIQYNVLNP